MGVAIRESDPQEGWTNVGKSAPRMRARVRAQQEQGAQTVAQSVGCDGGSAQEEDTEGALGGDFDFIGYR